MKHKRSYEYRPNYSGIWDTPTPINRLDRIAFAVLTSSIAFISLFGWYAIHKL